MASVVQPAGWHTSDVFHSVRQVVETACAFVGVVEAIEMMERCEARGRRRLVRGSSDMT
jgi:hypothetical protein